MPNRSKALLLAVPLVALLGFSWLALGQNGADYPPPEGLIRAVAAATPMYVKFDGVDGEAQEANHKGWSDLVSFNQGHAFPQSGVSAGRLGSVAFEDVVLTKTVDKAGPKLAEAVCKGSVFPKVQIHMTRTFSDGNKVWYACELRDVLLTKYGISASGQSETLPVEQVSATFSQIKVTYTEYDATGRAKGNVEYNWVVDGGLGLRL